MKENKWKFFRNLLWIFSRHFEKIFQTKSNKNISTHKIQSAIIKNEEKRVGDGCEITTYSGLAFRKKVAWI